MEKDVVGSKFNVSDSVPCLEWKLTNENRKLRGFNCRKGAVARIMDSVYVLHLYRRIVIPAGPCSVNGCRAPSSDLPFQECTLPISLLK